MKKSNRQAITATIMLLTIVLIYLISISGILATVKWISAIILLFASSIAITRINHMKNMFGAYLWGTKRGIKTIDNVAKLNKNAWNILADLGLVVSFGAASFLMFKHLRKRKYVSVLGVLSLLVMLFLVMPFAYLPMSFINLPQLNSQIASQQVAAASNQSSSTLGAIALSGLSIAGGFAAFVSTTLIYNSYLILKGIATYTYGISIHNANYSSIGSEVPGVAPLIPGITLPFFAGLIALLFLLAIHESSHGILARVAGAKLKQVGLLVLGVIPLGAFVEPDEKTVKKLSVEKQNRIFVAGVAVNMLAAVIFFALMLAMLAFVVPGLISTKVIVSQIITGYPAYNVIAPGSQILVWNGYPISNISSFTTAAASDTAFSNVSVITNSGSFKFHTNETGKIGVYLSEISAPPQGDVVKTSIYFLYTVISLSFLLNLLVAIVNLLPVPGFDGWQIYHKSINNKKLVKAFSYVIIIALIVNVLPWIWLA